MASTPSNTSAGTYVSIFFQLSNLIPRNSGTLDKGQLANLCQIFSLKRSGNKSALVERLREFSSNRDLWEG